MWPAHVSRWSRATAQAQQRRITELEARLDAAQRAAGQHAALTTAAQRRAAEAQEELENNAGARPGVECTRLGLLC